MTNSSETNVINYFNTLSPYLNRYLSIGIFLFGTVGNLLNCFTLTQPALRKNPCASLFLASSIASIITLISGVAVRLLTGWSADLTDTVAWLCKLRIFVLFSSRTIASWLITLATYDRWLSSSIDVHRRQMSTLKNAQRGITAIIILSSVAYAQIFYCYEANLTNTPLKCYGKTTWCRLLIDSEFTSISIFLPSLLMFLFGFMTVSNIRQKALRRIQPIRLTLISQAVAMNKRPLRLKRIDHYLLLMLFIQVVLITLFPLPQAIQNLYSNITRFKVKTPLENTINNFIFNLFLLLTYVTNGMPFYIYTLSGGTVFRKTLLDATRDLIHKIRCNQR